MTKSFFKSNLFLAGLTASALFALTRCGGGSNSSSAPEITPTLTSIYANVFSQSCVQCHYPGGAQNGATLDFSSITTSYQTLLSSHVGGASSSGSCGSVQIVVPGHPETSYLEAVLDSNYAHANFVQSGCTPYAVHLQNTNLSGAEKSALSSWIQAGAANN